MFAEQFVRAGLGVATGGVQQALKPAATDEDG
jgi:hypothetical protein